MCLTELWIKEIKVSYKVVFFYCTGHKNIQYNRIIQFVLLIYYNTINKDKNPCNIIDRVSAAIDCHLERRGKNSTIKLISKIGRNE